MVVGPGPNAGSWYAEWVAIDHDGWYGDYLGGVVMEAHRVPLPNKPSWNDCVVVEFVVEAFD